MFRAMLFGKLQFMVHIEVFKTPNPNFLKFKPHDCVVLGQSKGTLDISDVKYATVSHLAQQLFAIKGVTRVFYGTDYLSVAKSDDVDWQALKPEVYQLLSAHFQQKKPILNGNVALDDDEIDPNDCQTVQFIKQILSSRIRPNVQQDGGDVKFISFDEQSGIVRLKLVGACSGCPSSTLTLKGGIQKMLTYYIKQVKQVISEDQ